MANPNTAHEPSMEEILASIRQIISEDSDSPPPDRDETLRSAEAEPEDEAAADSAPAPAQERVPPPRASTGENGLARAEPAQERKSDSTMKTPASTSSTSLGSAAGRAPDAPAFSPNARPPQLQNAQPNHHAGSVQDDTLLSQRSDAAVSGSFSALAHTILAQNARTLEDLITEMLRPMLKDWLDDNLPPLVERLVREEIERVSRGRR